MFKIVSVFPMMFFFGGGVTVQCDPQADKYVLALWDRVSVVHHWIGTRPANRWTDTTENYFPLCICISFLTQLAGNIMSFGRNKQNYVSKECQ